MPDPQALATARSFLFAPGHRPERFAKAAASGAHVVVLDLEDAVGPADKAAARGYVLDWFAGGGGGMARINAADTDLFAEDLAALADLPPRPVMLPKAEPAALAALARRLPRTPVVALVETVAGLLALPELARHPALRRIAFGNLDFGSDLRISGAGGALDQARFRIALHSRAAGLAPPIDGVTIALEDEAAIRADVRGARDLGFGAKLCIHPRQVAAVNAGFAPAPCEVDWARRVVAAIEASGGAAVQVDGKMVDRPMVTRASAILAESAIPTTSGS